jgi:hypothetical protein
LYFSPEPQGAFHSARTAFPTLGLRPSAWRDVKFTIAIEEILGDELHWGSCGSVVEARDDDIGRFVKSGTSRELLRGLPFKSAKPPNLPQCTQLQGRDAYAGRFADWVET